MKTYYSNGKLLLTGEYLVLDGAKALAVPTQYGQDLVLSKIKEPELIWASFTNEGDCWFEAVFSLPKLRLLSASFNSNKEGSSETIAETLEQILQEARGLNPDFLQTDEGLLVKTTLNFPQHWGLGSSSTLINNIASWAEVNPFELLWNAFSGSGYDIACASNNSAITYQLEDKTPIVTQVDYTPHFVEDLFFVYRNQKQNSREGIQHYRESIAKMSSAAIAQNLKDINSLTDAFLKATDSLELNKVIVEHETLISRLVKLDPVKHSLFSDYFGEVKSLGAWGGDFVLATGNENTPDYFKRKGYHTVIPYTKMVL